VGTLLAKIAKRLLTPTVDTNSPRPMARPGHACLQILKKESERSKNLHPNSGVKVLRDLQDN